MGKEKFSDRLMHAVSVLRNKNEPFKPEPMPDYGPSSANPLVRSRYQSISSQKNLTASMYNHIAMDVAAVDLLHVRVDVNERFTEAIPSGLYRCLTVEANVDEAARHFKQNVVQTMFEQGVVAVVPVDTDINIRDENAFNILSLRVGRITSYYPRHVRVEVYNDKTGEKEEVTLPKSVVAIVENPLYATMNEPNSYLQQLLKTINRMDSIDDQISSGKMDLLIQLPYTVKSKLRQDQAENRRENLEQQLMGSKYGIGYIDATERVTQLNRPVENTMLDRVKYLSDMLYSQMGLTPAVFDGTADEKQMTNYYNRTIEPILAAIAEEFTRKFLSKTAQTQKQRIAYYRDPFQLLTAAEFAEVADKFTRNEILTSNEIRGLAGMRPSSDPRADMLRNSNVPQNDPAMLGSDTDAVSEDDSSQVMNDVLDEIDSTIQDIFSDLGVESEDPDDTSQIMNSAFDEIDETIQEIFKDLDV